MRTSLIINLESKIHHLKKKEQFYKNVSIKHIPAFQVYINLQLEKIQDHCNKTCNDINDQVREIEEIVNNICCLKAEH